MDFLKGGIFIMPTTIEHRLDILVHEIHEIKKELIKQKMEKVSTAMGKINVWKSLGNRISEKWDRISSVDEIVQQREKTV
jgi:uncharacterized protein YqgV (UPF0045/DUF77 family)